MNDLIYSAKELLILTIFLITVFTFVGFMAGSENAKAEFTEKYCIEASYVDSKGNQLYDCSKLRRGDNNE